MKHNKKSINLQRIHEIRRIREAHLRDESKETTQYPPPATGQRFCESHPWTPSGISNKPLSPKFAIAQLPLSGPPCRSLRANASSEHWIFINSLCQNSAATSDSEVSVFSSVDDFPIQLSINMAIASWIKRVFMMIVVFVVVPMAMSTIVCKLRS